MKKELVIFIVIFLLLALGMHMNQWLTHPMEHIAHLSEQKMPYHPLLYTFIVYLLVGFFRLIFGFILKLFRRER